MEEMTNIIPSMRFDEFKYSWKVTTLGEITRQYRESNKNVHHQNLLSLSYGKIVRKDIESKKGLFTCFIRYLSDNKERYYRFSSDRSSK